MKKSLLIAILSVALFFLISASGKTPARNSKVASKGSTEQTTTDPREEKNADGEGAGPEMTPEQRAEFEKSQREYEALRAEINKRVDQKIYDQRNTFESILNVNTPEKEFKSEFLKFSDFVNNLFELEYEEYFKERKEKENEENIKKKLK